MKDVVWLFFRLGCLGFGGPIATIAMMEDETVRRRKWIEPEHFNRAYAMIKVLPGPASTQMAIYLGQIRAGRFGGAIAGILFILPAFVLVLILSVLYDSFHSVPSADALFQGMQVAALVIIAESVLHMSKPYQRDVRAWVLALASAAVIFTSPRLEPVLVLGAGIFGAFFASWMFSKFEKFFVVGLAPTASAVPGALPTLISGPAAPGASTLLSGATSSGLAKLIMMCLKAGWLIFGTGLAIVPILEADVVGHYHWLTHPEFLDALAIGQITPGPVVITATFIGYRVAGLLGATLATIAIFSPGFINILLIIPVIEKRIQNSPKLKGFTLWAIPVVIGGIIGTSLRLARMSVTNSSLALLLVVTGVIVFWKKPPVWILIPACGVVSFLASRFLLAH